MTDDARFAEVIDAMEARDVEQKLERPEYRKLDKDRFFQGSEILEAPDIVSSVWGAQRAVVWPEGQPFWLVAPTGIGKTTVTGMLLKAGMRINGLDRVLGLPVKEFEKPTWYIAADRPTQIMRALKRGFGDEHRSILNNRLLIHKGPLPYELSDPKHSEYLVEDALELGVGQVVIDSMKDVAANLPDSEVGSAVKGALNNLVVAGIDVLVQHHLIKGQVKPKNLDAVYGSSMMMNSAGTVVLLWGLPGDGLVEIEMLKYADEEGIGPAHTILDQREGTIELAPESRMSDWMTLKQTITVRDAALFMFHNNDPTAKVSKSETRKASYRLDSYVGKKRIREPELFVERPGKGKPTIYTIVLGPTELELLAEPTDTTTQEGSP